MNILERAIWLNVLTGRYLESLNKAPKYYTHDPTHVVHRKAAMRDAVSDADEAVKDYREISKGPMLS